MTGARPPGKAEHLEDEAFLILHSGEIPEVAYHGSIYYLTEDPEGPGLRLETGELTCLKEAVVQRYREIILRDIDPQNRDRRIYRGVARCAVNWRRLARFARKESMDIGMLREEFAGALSGFLLREIRDVRSGARESSLNCPFSVVLELASGLGMAGGNLLGEIEPLCRER